jgi:hypothetical protein
MDSTPGLPPPTASPFRCSWSLSYLFSVAVLGSTFFFAAGPDVVPVCCAKAGAAKARPKATSVVAIRRFMVFSPFWVHSAVWLLLSVNLHGGNPPKLAYPVATHSH